MISSTSASLIMDIFTRTRRRRVAIVPGCSRSCHCLTFAYVDSIHPFLSTTSFSDFSSISSITPVPHYPPAAGFQDGLVSFFLEVVAEVAELAWGCAQRDLARTTFSLDHRGFLRRPPVAGQLAREAGRAPPVGKVVASEKHRGRTRGSSPAVLPPPPPTEEPVCGDRWPSDSRIPFLRTAVL